MKKVYVIIFLTLLILVTCCFNKPESVKLEVTSTMWSGWDFEHKPPQTVKEYTVTKGSKIKIGYIEKITFTVVFVSDNKVVIESDECLSEGFNGINMYADQNRFTIRNGKSIKLTTPSEDAGDIFYFKIKK